MTLRNDTKHERTYIRIRKFRNEGTKHKKEMKEKHFRNNLNPKLKGTQEQINPTDNGL